MSFETQYADVLDKTHEAVSKTTELWAQSVQRFLGTRIPGQPAAFDPSQLIDPLFEGVQNFVGQNPAATRLLDINRSFAKEMMGSMLSLQGLVRDYGEALLDVV